MSPLIPEKHSRYPIRIESDSKCVGYAPRLARMFGGQDGVHGAGAKAGAIERDVLVAGLFESGSEGVEHLDRESAGQLGAGNFDAGQVAVVAHAELAEAEVAQALFGALHLLEDFTGDSASVLDARGETRRGGAIPEGIAGSFGERADFNFCDACLGQWCENRVLFCGALAGTEIAGIVGVHSVGDVREAELGAERFA